MLDRIDTRAFAGVLADLGLPGYKPRFSVYLRAVAALGPAPIRDLARATGVTHSAASQTVAELARQGLVDLRPGADGRQRIVHLTDQARDQPPSRPSGTPPPPPPTSSTPSSRSAPPARARRRRPLDRRPFRDRMLASAWAREHPFFTAAVTAGDQAAPGSGPTPADTDR